MLWGEELLHLVERQLFVIACWDFPAVLQYRILIAFQDMKLKLIRLMPLFCQNQFFISVTGKITWLSIWDVHFFGSGYNFEKHVHLHMVFPFLMPLVSSVCVCLCTCWWCGLDITPFVVLNHIVTYYVSPAWVPTVYFPLQLQYVSSMTVTVAVSPYVCTSYSLHRQPWSK